ncbi:NAD(P)-binding protein (plasmid) [Agrobacterium sp. MA01]|uniref:FAD-dependent monooxygenase n=1 Tax=Agrobacterium sp. MA01 TaxID=2664893 RepID=UPI00129AC49C|nr:FAD-dependent monooxygenase [Agrobacterium sp. MA01]QGG93268.1 NAD(P)-binding protein [Agrobacterium sp. MA01]
MMNVTNVTIVGAGPTGLVLACDLLSRGINVVIIDKASSPSTTSRAIGLQPRGYEILERLGATDGLINEAIRASGTLLHLGSEQSLMLDQTVDCSGPLLIGQDRLEARLRARLAELGGRVLWGWKLDDLRQTEENVVATISHKSSRELVRADWLVGCDGAHSAVRKLLNIPFQGSTFPETMVLADVDVDTSFPADTLQSWLHPDGLFAMAPLPGGRWRLFAELNGNDPAMERRCQDLAETNLDPCTQRELQSLCNKRTGNTVGAIVKLIWSSQFRFHQRLAACYRVNRCVLAGDAAHVHSAQGAQGMNMGIGDAFNIGWKLAAVIERSARSNLLQTYELERRPVAAKVLGRTSYGWRLTLGKTLLSRVVRDFVVLPLMRTEAIQRSLARSASQLHETYRSGPLGVDSLIGKLKAMWPGRVVPGDRLPDLKVKGYDGAEVTLGRVIGNNWAIIRWRDAAYSTNAWIVEVKVCSSLLDCQREVEDIFLHQTSVFDPPFRTGRGCKTVRLIKPQRDELFLVRPDGHLAQRTQQFTDITKWIERLRR